MLSLYGQISPINSLKYDSSDDNSSSRSKRTVVSLSTKSSKISSKGSRISVPGKISEDSVYRKVNFSSLNNKNSTGTNISCDFLPSTLVKLGQVLHALYLAKLYEHLP
jgi:hypothetical protein